MKQLYIPVSILIAATIVGGTVFMSGKSSGDSDNLASVANTSIVDGKQIIEITAKGKYSPKLSRAKADMPTILRIKTQGTFDCSSNLTIPSLGYRKNLPSTGITDIEVPPQTAGTSLRGICSMGMYGFSVNFN